MSSSSIIDKVFTLCKNLTHDYDESHDVKHHVRVLHNSMKIYHSMKIKEDYPVVLVLTFSSMFHDVLDHKYSKDMEAKRHKLEEFMSDYLSPTQIEHVFWIIDHISYSKEKYLGEDYFKDAPNELILSIRHIVSDADKIDALGKHGLERCRIYSQILHPELTAEEVNLEVLKHCKDKLVYLRPLYIRTSMGKDMSLTGHQEIQRFIEDNV